jgi:hypothetical protein
MMRMNYKSMIVVMMKVMMISVTISVMKILKLYIVVRVA